MAELLPWPRSQFFDDNGDPLAGGRLYSYRAGTTIPLATYADKSATTPNANPVILNSRGEALVYLSAQAYKLILKDDEDQTIWTLDNFVVTQTDSETLAQAIAAAQDAQEAAELAESNAESARDEAIAVIQGAIFGSRVEPIGIEAASGIPFTGSAYQNHMYVQGNGGAIDITAEPQITPGTIEGQKLTIQGRHGTNSVRLHHGDGVKLKNEGEVYLFEDSTISFWWDTANWVEV